MLPPGQIETLKLPQTGEVAPAPAWDAETFRLHVGTACFDLPALQALGGEEFIVDIHCVTGWTRPQTRFTGVRLLKVLEAANLPVQPFLRFIAHSPRSHDTTLPWDVAAADTWLVWAMDGEPLSTPHGGPVRSLTPSRYFYKSLKWLKHIEGLNEDRLGYWERESAYHNEANPWQEQRFDEARTLSEADLAQLKQGEDFSSLHGKILLKARLGGWQPANLDLSNLQIKNSSLRKAQLAGARCLRVNWSLSNLEGADLRRAQFIEADLEGVSFAGADLSEASMDGVWLSATRFYRDFANGKRLAAKVSGLKIQRALGLIEAQAAFLRAGGAVLDVN
jgi:hypothetical protein